MNWHKIRLLSTIAALLFGMASCAVPPPTDSSAPRPDGRLIVGTTANYPPLVFSENGAIVGIEADFAAEISKELDRSVEMIDMPWEQLANSLESGKVDVVMAGVSITENRKQLAAFSDSYMEIGQMTLIRTADLGRLGAPGDIEQPGRVIGVENNTTGHRFVEQAYPKATISVFSSSTDAVAALRERKVDYFIHDAPTIWMLTLGANATGSQDILALYYPLTREHLAWAVKKDNLTLLEQMNSALAKMQHDGRAQRIINKWIKASATVSSPARPVEF